MSNLITLDVEPLICYTQIISEFFLGNKPISLCVYMYFGHNWLNKLKQTEIHGTFTHQVIV